MKGGGVPGRARVIAAAVACILAASVMTDGAGATETTITPPYASGGTYDACSVVTVTGDCFSGPGTASDPASGGLAVSATSSGTVTQRPPVPQTCVGRDPPRWCEASGNSSASAVATLVAVYHIPPGMSSIDFAVTVDVSSAAASGSGWVEVGARLISDGGHHDRASLARPSEATPTTVTLEFTKDAAADGEIPEHNTMIEVALGGYVLSTGNAIADVTVRQISAVTHPVPPNEAPVAGFDFTCVERSCDFDASGSSDPDGDALTYSWDFGDGTTGSGMTVDHTYAADGTYEVTVTVRDPRGASDTATERVSVAAAPVNQAPVADFESTCIERACSFDASGSSDPDGDALTYSWDFGDGTTGTGETPNHTFAADGTYGVTLTARDPDDASDTSTEQVGVSNRPIELTAQRDGRTVQLRWGSANDAAVDIYRNGSLIETTANDGSYDDRLRRNDRGRFRYIVCEHGTAQCSNKVVIKR
jgi:PKD repeat protein